MYAPIVLFAYNRPLHIRKTVEALQNNLLAKDSELIVISDGPKYNEQSMAKVRQVREYIKTITGFKKLTIIEKEENAGLAESIRTGVTEIVNKYGKIIVFEDDLVSSPFVLKFLNDALDRYEKEDNVVSITGYIYALKGNLPDTFFIKGADCLAWATWQRGWALFEKDGAKLLAEIKSRKLEKDFDMQFSYPYTKLLEDQVAGKANSWAIRWYASAFLRDKLTLYPGKSLVQHIGGDGTGTNCGVLQLHDVELSAKPIILKQIPAKENRLALKQIERFFRSQQLSIVQRAANKIRRIVRFKIPLQKKLCQIVEKEQLFPTWLGIFLNPFYFARKGIHENILMLSEYITGKVLDVGCGQKPYADLFKTSQYVGLEYDSPENRKYKKADFFYDGTSFPFTDMEFNSVISSQVLEHVFSPKEFLHEVWRVLKDDGVFLLTVPFVWDEHEQPHDFARYSSFGLKHLLKENGFVIVEHKKSISDIRVIFQLINCYIYKKTVTKNGYLNTLFTGILISPFNILGEILSKMLPGNKDLYLDNIVLARKTRDKSVVIGENR